MRHNLNKQFKKKKFNVLESPKTTSRAKTTRTIFVDSYCSHMIVFLLGKAKEAQDMNRPEKIFPSHSIFQYLTKASDRVSFKYSILLIRRTEWAALEFRNPIPPRLHCVNVSSETQNHLNENSFAVHNHCAPDTARLISHAMFLMCQFGEVPFYFISRFDVS